MLKTRPRTIPCKLKKEPVTVNITYQVEDILGGDTIEALSTIECQHQRECSLSGLYDNCPLKEVDLA